MTNAKGWKSTLLLCAGLASLGIGGAWPSEAFAQADVTGVRFGLHGEKTRLVLDMTKAADYRIDAKPGGTEIEIVLSDTDWGQGISDAGRGKGLVDGYMRLDEGKGETHIFVTAASPIRVDKSFTLKKFKAGDAPFRLVVDLAETPAQVAAPAAVAEPAAPAPTAEPVVEPVDEATWAPVEEPPQESPLETHLAKAVAPVTAPAPQPRPAPVVRPLSNASRTACERFQARLSPFTGSDPEAMFLWAECAREQGELELAAQYYRDVLKLDPNAQRARLELGEVLFELREHGESREQFAQVLQSEPPKVVAANVRAKMLEVERHEKGIDPPKDFNVRMTAGVVYDTNVNGGPATGTEVNLYGTPFTLDDTSTVQDDTGFLIGMDGHVSIHRDNDLTLDANVGFSTNEYRTYEQFETTSLYGRLAMRHVAGDKKSVGLPVTVQKAWLGGASYSDTLVIEPDFRIVGNDGSVFSVSVPLKKIDYAGSSDKSGGSRGVKGAFAINMNNGWTFRPEALFDSYAADVNYESYDVFTGSLLLSGKVSNRLNGFGRGAASYTRYDAINPVYSKRRSDNNLTLGFGLNYDLRDYADGVSAGLTYTFLDNQSSIDANTYERHQTMFTVTKKF